MRHRQICWDMENKTDRELANKITRSEIKVTKINCRDIEKWVRHRKKIRIFKCYKYSRLIRPPANFNFKKFDDFKFQLFFLV